MYTWNSTATLCVFLTTAALSATPVGTGFTYQGQLKSGGSPANGSFNMVFKLFDDSAAGSQVGPTLTFDGAGGNPPPVAIANGLFTVQLDFTVSPYTANQARWLEVSVDGQTLTPRQALTAAPFALNTRGLNVDASGNVGITGTTVTNYPLSVNAGPSYAAIEGYGSSSSWPAAGVYGTHSGAGGKGVYGYANVPNNTSFGVYGESSSYFGYGVFGLAIHTSGQTIGVYGKSSSTSGFGVYGVATATSGQTYGVLGEATSPDGYAGYFRGRGYFSGNVGIGTASPTANLDVAGTVQATGLKLTTSPSAGYVLTSDSSGVGTWQAPTAGAGQWTSSGSNIYYNDGNVGLGTTSPLGKLEIHAGADQFGGGGQGAIALSFALDGYRHWIRSRHNNAADNGNAIDFFVNTSSSPDGSAGPGTGNVQVMTLGGSGNVGIGNSNPSFKLDVSGNLRVTSCSGCSDARFKTHITPLEGAREAVSKLRGVNFDWRCDAFPERGFDEGRQIGLIAQEVRSVVPEVVQEGSDGYLSVDYGRLTPLLVEAVKEQQKQQCETDEQIEALKRENVDAVKQVKCENDARIADQQRVISELYEIVRHQVMENAQLRAELDELKKAISEIRGNTAREKVTQ